MANMRLVKLKNRPSKGVFVFEYMQEQIERLRGQGKERTVETYQSALNSFLQILLRMYILVWTRPQRELPP